MSDLPSGPLQRQTSDQIPLIADGRVAPRAAAY
jgi:hypothetical protein